jgi:hypothetical protein
MSIIGLGHDNTVLNFTWKCKNEGTIHLIRQVPLDGDYDRTQLLQLPALSQKAVLSTKTWLEHKEDDVRAYDSGASIWLLSIFFDNR